MSQYLIMIATWLVTCLGAFAIGRLTTRPTIRRLRAALARAAWRRAHDPLTGMLSRTGLLDAHALNHACNMAAASQPMLGLLIDLDNFKPVNDRYGHDTGDDLLFAIADRIACTAITLGGMAARLAGDEFAVLLPIRDRDLTTIATMFVAEIAQPVALGNGDTPPTVTVTASIGVVVAEPGDPLERVTLRRADIAMYHAKHAGGNRYAIYQPGMGMPTAQPHLGPRFGPRLRDLHQQHPGVDA